MKTVNWKRISLHVAFWLVYMMEDITLIYLWDKDRLAQFSPGHQLLLAICNSMTSLIPKLLFIYYALYYNLPRLLNTKTERKKYIALLLLALVATTFLYRAIGVYFQGPVIYSGLVTFTPYFSGRWFFQFLMDIGCASGAAIVIKQFRLQLAGREKEASLIRDKLETELKYLRNQTNPHFLFNTLNNIYSLARKKSDLTADAVMKLSKLLRFMLYDAARPLITIADEIRMLEDYIDLEKIRYNERLTVRFFKDISGE